MISKARGRRSRSRSKDESQDEEWVCPEEQAGQLQFCQISLLPEKERKRLRKKFRKLPSYIFMSLEEKDNYFKGVNQKYSESLGLVPVKTLPKRVVFDGSVRVAPYYPSQNPSSLEKHQDNKMVVQEQ